MICGAAQLRDWIKRRVMNQREAAQLLGVTDAFLSQILSGVRQPGLANAINIERTTGISVESWLPTEVSNTEAGERDSVSNQKIAGR